jgi:outer membrane murein-binding lipoprotein Lpp
MTAFFGVLADMWDNGLSAWEMLAGGASGGQADQMASPSGDMFAPVKRMARLFDSMSPRAGGAGQAAPPHGAGMSPAIAQASGATAMSLMRYWRILAEVQLRYQRSLMQDAAARAGRQAAGSPADCRIHADEVRAFLREIGDAATQEARRLQQELEKIGESVAQAADKATPSQHPHRRWHEVKE